MSAGNWTFRLATPDDAASFAAWVSGNPLIDKQDIQEGLNKNNPTTLTFVACFDGQPVWFAPVYLSAHLAHLGVNPDSTTAQKIEGLARLMEFVGYFMYEMGIRQITTLTKAEYPIARWAKKHGFIADLRQLFKWDLRAWVDRSSAGTRESNAVDN